MQFVLWADVKGRFYTSEGRSGNVADSDYFKAIMEEGKTRAVSDGLISRVDGKAVLVLARPFAGAEGKIGGIVAAPSLLEYFSAYVSGITMGENGYAYIMDRRGYIIAHRNRDYVLKLDTARLRQGRLGRDSMPRPGRPRRRIPPSRITSSPTAPPSPCSPRPCRAYPNGEWASPSRR